MHGLMTGNDVPVSVKLDPSMQWAAPAPARVFEAESWFPSDAKRKNAQIAISRRAQITPAAVWSYLSQNMSWSGWTLTSSAPASDASHFTATFTSGRNRAVAVVWSGSSHEGATVEGLGTKVEMIWWSEDDAFVDRTPPITTSDAVDSYDSPTVTIHLTATDAGGVAATYYRLDGGAVQTGTTVDVLSAGWHTLEFWSVDESGNMEQTEYAYFTMTGPDLTAPTTIGSAIQSNPYAPTTVSLAASDAGGSGLAGTYYTLDGGVTVSATTFDVWQGGVHTVEYWSVDLAGNEELPHKILTFTHTTPPNPEDM